MRVVTYRYRAFGLTIESDFALAPLAEPIGAAGDQADLRVRRLGAHDAGQGAACLIWDGVCKLVSDGGRELGVLPSPAASARELALAIGGAGVALALHQRGVFVVHGSCVEINGAGVCFVGSSGAGKSTLAAAFQRAGHALISDGMTAVDWSDGTPRAQPGWPSVKLLPDAAHATGLQGAVSAPLHPASAKSLYPAPESAARGVALRWLFVLRPGSPIQARRVGPSAAAFELVRHAYLAEDFAIGDPAVSLGHAARLAGRVPLSFLDRGTSMTELRELMARVVQTLALVD